MFRNTAVEMRINRLSQIAETEVHPTRRSGSPRFYVSYRNIEALAGPGRHLLITFASVFGGLLYQFWVGPDQRGRVNLGVGLAEGLLYAYVASSRGLYRLPVLLAPSRYLGADFRHLGDRRFFAAIFLFFLKATRAFAWLDDYVGLLQIVALLLARWLAEKTSRSLIAKGSLPGRRVVTIGEPYRADAAEHRDAVSLFRPERGRPHLALDRQGRRLERRDRRYRPRAARRARKSRVDEFVVALRWSSKELLETVARAAARLAAAGASAARLHHPLGARPARAFTSGPALSLELQRAPLEHPGAGRQADARFHLRLRRDRRSVAVFLVIALAIKLDSQGPVIFRQRRNGFNSQAVRDLQIPLHDRDGRRRRITQARKATAGSPGWASCCAAPAWTSCRSCSTC